MKKILTIIAISLLPLFAFAQKTLPSVEVKDLEGQTVNIQTVVEDKVPVVLTFWATSCKPCLMELGALNDCYPDWTDEMEFKIVAVSTDDSRSSAKIKPMVNGRGWTDFTVLSDENGDLKRAMNVQAPPVLFLLDREGNIVYTHIGYTPGNEVELYDQILKLQ